MSNLKWVVAGVDNLFGWPTVDQEIEYRGDTFLLRPETDNNPPSVCVFREKGITYEEGAFLINQFLGALAWSENYGVRVTAVYGNSGPKPIQVGKGSLHFVSEPWPHHYLPIPKDPKSELALAIYREAMNLNSCPYQFPGYFKILNIQFNKGKDQISWINNNITNLTDDSALKRLEILKATVNDLGDYFYSQGRCAVAHAFSNDVINPDLVEDENRLRDDLPVIKSLAELMISQEFGILTNLQFYESIKHVTREEDLPEDYVTPK